MCFISFCRYLYYIYILKLNMSESKHLFPITEDRTPLCTTFINSTYFTFRSAVNWSDYSIPDGYNNFASIDTERGKNTKHDYHKILLSNFCPRLVRHIR